MSHEALARIVFERTPYGLTATKSLDESIVPKRLRTLLMAVDGRTSVAQFVPFLTALAPLSEKFEELERLGVLRRKIEGKAEPVVSKAPPPLLPTPQAMAQAPVQVPVQAPVQVPVQAQRPGNAEESLDDDVVSSIQAGFAPGSEREAPTLAGFDAQLMALERMMVKVPNEAPPREFVAPQAPGAVTLADLINEISSFLARVAGMDGLPAALLLEQIGSLDQLRRELPDYAQLVAPYGAAAQAHLAQLETLLARAR